mmetsp:Transcript_25128/g.28919  ORF Transcript_25128/g.28919 Transcript_25128/m.28919 type:complete len:152 (+) Transcript_25128:46-501(+)
MMASSRMKADRAIHARREEEARLSVLNNALRENANMRRTAEWEQKTDGLVVKRIVQTRISQKKGEKERALDERRRRLALKLQQEEAVYQQELQDNLETPEQVREQMAKRLFEFKKQRQEERKQLVEQALEKRAKLTTDDLRLADSKFYTQQ